MAPPSLDEHPPRNGNMHPQAALWANPTAPAGLRSTLINDSSKINNWLQHPHQLL